MKTRRRRRFRVFRRALFGLLLLLALAYVFREPLFGGLVRGAITDALSESLGGRYAIDEVGGSWISDLRIEGLRTLEAPAEGPLVDLGIAEAEVSYGLLGLLRGEGLAAIESVDVRGGAVGLDLTRPGAVRSDASADPQGTLDDVLAWSGRLDVQADVEARTDGGPVRLQAVHVSRAGADVRLDVADVQLPDRFSVQGPLAGVVSRVGEDRWRWTSESVLGGVRFSEIEFDKAGHLEGRIDLAAGQVALFADERALHVSTRGLDVARLPEWVTALVEDRRLRPARGSLSGHVGLPWQAPLRPDFGVEADGLAWPDGRPFDVRAYGDVGADGDLRLSSLDVRGEGARASLQGAVLDSGVPYLFRTVREIEVAVDEIEDFLPQLGQRGSLRLRARGSPNRTLNVEEAVFDDGSTTVTADGHILLPADPADWRSAVVGGNVRWWIPHASRMHPQLEGSLDLRATVQGSLEVTQFSVNARTAAARMAGVDFLSLSASGRATWPSIYIHDGVVRSSAGVLKLSGGGNVEPDPDFWVSYDLDATEPSALLAMASDDVPAVDGAVHVSGRVSRRAGAWRAAASVQARALVVDGHSLDRVGAALELEDGVILVEDLSVRSSHGRVIAEGRLDPQAQRAEVTALSWRDDDRRARLTAPLTLTWEERTLRVPDLRARVDDVLVRAGLSVDLATQRGTLEGLRVEYEDTRVETTAPLVLAWSDDSVRVEDLRLRIDDDIDVEAALDVDFARERGTISRLRLGHPEIDAALLAPLELAREGDDLRVRGLDVHLRDDVRVRAAALINPERQQAIVETLRVESPQESAALRAPARLSWADHGLRARGLDVAMRGGVVTGRVSWDGALAAQLAGRGLKAAGLVPGISGRADLDLTVEDERADLVLRSPDCCVAPEDGPGWCGALALRARQVPGEGVTVEALRFENPGEFLLTGEMFLPHSWSSDGLVGYPQGKPRLALDLALSRWPGAPRELAGPLRAVVRGDAGGLHAQFEARDLLWRDKHSARDDAALELRVTPGAVQGTLRVVGTEAVDVTGQVSLDRGLDWTRPGDWSSILDAARIDGSLDARVTDWRAIQELAPGLRTLAGTVRLRGTVRGPLRKPDLVAQLDLEDARLRLQGDLPTFADLDARIHWRDDRVHIERFTGSLGHAPFRLSGSAAVPFDALPTFDVRLAGQNLLLSRSRHLRLRSDVELHLAGVLDALRLGGRAQLTNALYTRPMALEGDPDGDGKVQLFTIRDWPFNKMAFDVRVGSDESLRVKNNIVSARIGIDAVLRGKGETPEPEGRVYFRDAVVKLPLSTLQGVQGELTFTRSDPLHPMLRATARSRAKGYELDVRAWGALPDLELSVFSRPQLPPEDAITLLTTGNTREGLRVEGITASSFTAVLGVFGGAALAPLGSPPDPDRPSFFDRFDVTVGRFTSRTGRSTLEAEFQVDKKLYLRGERDRFDENNLGLVWRMRFR